METLIVKPGSRSKMEALKAFLTAPKIDFQTVNVVEASSAIDSNKVYEADKPYNPEFVAKVKKGDEDYKAGRYKAIKDVGEVDKLYSPEFVAKIKASKEEIKQGKGVNITPEDLWK